MAEWLKAHAWKACIRQKRIGGSNPPLSAKNSRKPLISLRNQGLFLCRLQNDYQKFGGWLWNILDFAGKLA